MNTKQGRKASPGDLYTTQKEYYRDAYSQAEAPPWDSAFDPLWLKRALKKIGPAKGRCALDLGTGHGKGASILKKAGWRAVGVDYLAEPLARARANTAGRLLLVQADALQPPFRERAFDLILDWDMFHHIRRRDADEYIGVVASLLAPSGKFLLGCFSTKFRHKGEKKRKRSWILHHGHYDRFSTKKELAACFSTLFAIDSIKEDPKGFYLVMMTLRGV